MIFKEMIFKSKKIEKISLSVKMANFWIKFLKYYILYNKLTFN